MRKSFEKFIMLLLIIILTFLPSSSLIAASKTTSKTATKTSAKVNYSKYSNKKIAWYYMRNKKHKQPYGPSSAKTLKKYDAFFCASPKKKDKVIYLTFDCGYENGQTRGILNTLKKNKIKAIFFVTKSFIRENPDLVKRMKKEGHLVGNHTVSHPSMPDCSVSKLKREIKNCEKAMKEYTGYTMDPFIRPPMGEYSMRSLKVTKDLGYTTILWSYAYYDYDEKNQPTVSHVKNGFKTYYHNGMIPLIHAISKSNRLALPSILKDLKKRGYRFGDLYELDGQNQKKVEAKKK